MSIVRAALSVLALAVVSVAGVRAQSGITGGSGNQVTCASDDGGRHYCRVNTSRGVQLVNQRSGSPCVQGQTWGYDRSGIWVDRGCRADFYLGGYNNGGNQGTITCSSDNGGRNYCRANTAGGVRMVNQRSGSPCIQGQTWGYDRNGIWVDRGCRADFALNAGTGIPPMPGPGISAIERPDHLFVERREPQLLLCRYKPWSAAGEPAQRLALRTGANLGLQLSRHLGRSRLPC